MRMMMMMYLGLRRRGRRPGDHARTTALATGLVPTVPRTAVRTVARSTGAKVYELDPLVTGDGALTAYEDVMRANLAVLREALGQ